MFLKRSREFCFSVELIFSGRFFCVNIDKKLKRFLWNPFFSILLQLRFNQIGFDELVKTLNRTYLWLVYHHTPDPYINFYF